MSKAPDPEKHPCKPFRIGSDTFWKNSGCDWKRQVKRSKKFPHLEKDQWAKIARKQFRKEKLLPEDNLAGDEVKWETNQIGLAPPEIKEMYREEFRKKWHLETSNTTDAFKTIDSLFQFVPGKANGSFL